MIAERRGRIAEALDTLETEFPRLAEDLAFRDWRNGPIYPYKPKSLTANRRRPKALMHPRELIQDLFAICDSQAGSVQRDSPQGQRRLTIAISLSDPASTLMIWTIGRARQVPRGTTRASSVDGRPHERPRPIR